MRPSAKKFVGLRRVLLLACLLLAAASTRAELLPSKSYTTADGLARDAITRILRDSRGFLWFGTVEGFSRFDGYSFTNYTTAQGLPHLLVTDILETRAGDVWVGFYNGGVARYRDGRFDVFSTADGLPAGMIRALYLDDVGRLWLASGRGGFARLDDPTAERPSFVGYTTASGLASNDVWCLTGDRWGRIYAGTGRGVSRFDPSTGHVEQFTTADGLARGQVEVAFRDPQGALWFGTPEGLSRLVPQPDEPQPPPPVLISGLRVAGVAQPVSELGVVELAPRTLEPEENHVQIDFVGLSFGAGELLRYQYRLEGADADWSAPTIAFNNGFGRPWFANAPQGSKGDGTITVIDGNGRPLAGAPDPVAGGVFAGDATDRNSSTTHGLTAGALATALLTKSPDGSTKAVFLAALADGSVVQVHVQKGVDGLAPAGSFTPIQNVSTAKAESNDAGDITRVGMLFNWAPTRKVFVTDPLANRILVLDLTDDGTLFHATSRYIKSSALDRPVDMAPATVEVAAHNFASNTTLGAGSDFYVLNRGNNTIVRMTQDGSVAAVRGIQTDVAGFRASGIATSPDARTIYVSGTTPGANGVVLKLAAFGEGFVTESLFAHTPGGSEIAQGAGVFSFQFGTSEGVGPLFNGQSCNSCHNAPAAGGMGAGAETFVTRVAKTTGGKFDSMDGHGGPVARQFSVDGMGQPCGLPTGVPPQATLTSRRSAMSLEGTSLLDFIADGDILKVQAAEPEAVRGRRNILADGRAGRFGWKAQTATLVEFMGEAMRDEIGITNPLEPLDLVHGCGADKDGPEADGVPLTALAAFLNTIDPPQPSAATLNSQGASVFNSIGCAQCHTPSFPGPGKTMRAYTDLLLHDMGPSLADGFEQASATGSEFRTAPLWRVSERAHFLHDGRAGTIADAVAAHGGQGAAAAAAFGALSPSDRQALLDFLAGL